jgi:hypothetical protein
MALQLLALHCMPLTLDEIVNLEQNLRQEIAAKQRLLSAYETFRAEMGNGGIFPPASAAALPATPPPPPAAPAVPEPPPYCNPDLQAWKSRHPGNGGIVSWAIQRMTKDYSGRDIAKLLRSENEYMTSAKVSVVLTRLKARGEIVEITPGTGRTGAIFRRPTNPLPVRKEETAAVADAADTPEQANFPAEVAAELSGEVIPQPSAVSA